MIFEIIKVEVSVISQSRRMRLITLTGPCPPFLNTADNHSCFVFKSSARFLCFQTANQTTILCPQSPDVASCNWTTSWTQSIDHLIDPVYGPPHRPSPWATSWTQSIDHLMDPVYEPPHKPSPWTTSWTQSMDKLMDPVYRPPHGPSL